MDIELEDNKQFISNIPRKIEIRLFRYIVWERPFSIQWVKIIRMGSVILKEIKNIICTMVKYGETFYGSHTTLNASCSEVKKSERLPWETKNAQKKKENLCGSKRLFHQNSFVHTVFRMYLLTYVNVWLAPIVQYHDHYENTPIQIY